MTFGQKFKEFREKSGYSQKNIASMLFVTTQNVIDWENDKTYPSAEMLYKLSQIFSISVDELSVNSQDSNSERPIAKAEIVADKKEIKKIFKFKFLSSISALVTVLILFAVIFSVSICVNQYNVPYDSIFETGAYDIIQMLFYPTALLITVLLLCIIKNNAISTACNQTEGHMLFFNGFITVKNTNGASKNIQYSSVKKIYELDYYLVLSLSDGEKFCIKKENAEGYFDYVINLFRSHGILKNYTVTRTRNKPKFSQSKLLNIKSIITSHTVFVIGSIYFSILIWELIMMYSIQHGRSTLTMLLCFLPVLIPLTSLIIGIITFCKKIKSNRLIIASAIMMFFTIIYSSLFSFIPLLSNTPQVKVDFENTMQNRGFIVSDITTQRTENYLDKCYVASHSTDDYDIYCLEFDTSSSFGGVYANKFYDDTVKEFKEKDHPLYYRENSSVIGNARYYTGYDTDEYFVICMNNTTVMYSCVDFEYAKELKEIFNNIAPVRISFSGI